MNEVDFVEFSRSFQTGDVVLLNAEDELLLDADFPQQSSRSAATGFVLRFVDPAKPLIVYQKSQAPDAMCIDFVHDLLYAQKPDVFIKSFSLWRTREALTQDARKRWIASLEECTNRSLQTDTALFNAYSDGILGVHFALQQPRQWIIDQFELLGLHMQDLYSFGQKSVWEGHNEYHFC